MHFNGEIMLRLTVLFSVYGYKSCHFQLYDLIPYIKYFEKTV